MSETRSEKYQQARNTLPVEMQADFDKLVAEYRYRAALRHGAPYVSYIVLADLIRAGWRQAVESIDEDK